MAFNQVLQLLTAQRRVLAAQLAAIDDAIAAVHRADAVEPPLVADGLPAAAPAAEDVVPRRVAPKRALSDEHKHALTVGARKARESREVAKGAAREGLADAFVPAIGKREAAPPRLIKKPR